MARRPGDGARRPPDSAPAPGAVHQAERQHVPGGVLQAVVDRAGGEHAGEERAQRAARAVHAESVQRIVIAELAP